MAGRGVASSGTTSVFSSTGNLPDLPLPGEAPVRTREAAEAAYWLTPILHLDCLFPSVLRACLRLECVARSCPSAALLAEGRDARFSAKGNSDSDRLAYALD